MKIYKGKEEFNYGNCFVIAIGQAFNIRKRMLNVLFSLINVNQSDGATTKQCDKVIKSLAYFRNKTVKYVSLKSPILIIEFIVNNKKGTFLLNSDDHICYYRNGRLYDSFYDSERKRLTEDRLIGYWEITEQVSTTSGITYSSSTTSYRHYV